MSDAQWTFAPSDDAVLEIRTGVTGKAAKMGHRLTIAVTRWRAVVDWAGEEPASLELTADVDSIDVVDGQGGLTPLLGPEKVVARLNAVKTFDAKKFPHITFRADDITATDDGFRLDGTLEIHGESRDHRVHLRVKDEERAWRLSAESQVRQSDFGIKPYSQMLGAMKVVDEVSIAFSATRAKPS
ncbi:YceI family protein [Williamsia herbipolensis]|uniref:YceI family protein n=1 Tax=Williamsia herbipolensis TaxID=1603258 RepID=A0AAU4K406_9NOCA|nr:YceI family protein [Williamsia herbipolensis]